MKTSERIINYIKDNGEASATELTNYLDISERAVFKQLARLLASGELTKIGLPPKVFYKILKVEGEIQNEVVFAKELEKFISDNFLHITPLGKYLEGTKGFINWCKERQLDVNQQAKQYRKLLKSIDKNRVNGVINSTHKFIETFVDNYLTEAFYLDFYSIPQFGKTKLGQLLLYAKQSQDRLRIKAISDLVKPSIEKLIQIKKIEAVGFIPPTVRREVQFMRELEKNLNLNIPAVKITKIKTEVIVPQKTLSKLPDRIVNAKNTMVVEDKRKFKNILLIDDAIGSGATLNETAKKILASNVAKNVFGLAITGSYKGFDVISEV